MTGEEDRLLAPLQALSTHRGPLLGGALALLTLAWLGSGLTMVEPDEVGLVLRAGRLVGEGAAAVHPPGLMFALPRPIDEVVRVKVKRVWEVEVDAFHHGLPSGADPASAPLDPERAGYLLTGDHNIVQVVLVARFRIDDPVAWALDHAFPADQVRVAVQQTAVVTVGELGVDDVLGEGRTLLMNRLLVGTQERLDAAGVGVGLVAVELVELAPALQVVRSFEKVQSAYIAAETRMKEAQRYREITLPAARTAGQVAVDRATSRAAAVTADARGAASAFTALDEAWREAPEVVEQRLYREAMERVVAAAGTRTFVPPPPPGGYRGMRVSVPATHTE
ncbi:MAG: membrane protease subunit HflK [Myxococcota bacterium]|jgi:membrane protease subunit HflK